MNGETDLTLLLATMSPELDPQEYVFCSVAPELVARYTLSPICQFHEQEGLTIIITRSEAERHRLRFMYPSQRITLCIHSSLDAVGLLAAVSAELASAGISTNVVSAFYHDHLFISEDKVDEALAVLQSLSESAKKRC